MFVATSVVTMTAVISVITGAEPLFGSLIQKSYFFDMEDFCGNMLKPVVTTKSELYKLMSRISLCNFAIRMKKNLLCIILFHARQASVNN